MTVNEITTNIALPLGKADDFSFKRSLLRNINAWRATLIKQTLDRTPGDRKFFTKTLYAEMEDYTTIESVDICQPRARSKRVIPATLRSMSTTFDFVGSIDDNIPFGIFTPGTERFLRTTYTEGIPRYSLDNEFGRRLIVNKRGLVKVKLVGIPDDPEEWFMFNCKTGDCDFWNSIYPVPEDISQRIVQSILSVDLRRPTTIENKEVEVNEQ